MAARVTTGGFVVTSGRFTNDTQLLTQGRNIHLVDGPRMLAMVQQARKAGADPECTVIPAPEAVNISRPSQAADPRASAGQRPGPRRAARLPPSADRALCGASAAALAGRFGAAPPSRPAAACARWSELPALVA
jgi:restriction system protein